MSCGCHDTPIPLENQNPCVDHEPVVIPVCPDGEPCEDVVKDICVQYTGTVVLPCLGIQPGDRLDVIIAAIERAVCELQTCCAAV